jgi:uncharacterized membrane protein YedE/YeeE
MQQDWFWGLVGGLTIGLGGALYLLGNGRVMGASGILGGLLDGSERAAVRERLLFLLGVVSAPVFLTPFYRVDIDTHISDRWLLLAIAGLLVGVGTRMANGCTSGHGVCGISRLAPRGIVATLVYLFSGAVTVYLLRHVLGLR